MKLNKILIGAFFAFALSSIFTSCVDDWKFGDSFLEKAQAVMLPRTPFSTMLNILVSSFGELMPTCIMVSLTIGMAV